MRKSQSAFGAALVGIFFAGLTISALRPEAPTRSQQLRGEAVNWAKSRSESAVTDFDSYSRLPMPHRRALYFQLSWPVREELWRRHIQSFLIPPEQLTPTQKTMVQALGQPLTPREAQFVELWRDSVVERAYKPALTDEQRRAIAGPLCAKAGAILGPERSRLIFGQIGPIDSSYTNLLRADAAARINEASLLNSAAARNHWRRGLARVGLYRPNVLCWCHVSSLCDCGPDAFCVNSNCETRPAGCGCGGFFVCDGTQCAF